MYPEETTLGNLLLTRNPLVVPKYQRAYSWDKEELTDFIKDIRILRDDCAANPANPRRHFFGGIVTIHTHAPGTQPGRTYEIVDGQQRLATFVISLNNIAKALRAISEAANQANDGDLAQEALAHFNKLTRDFIEYDDIEGGRLIQKQRLTLSKADEIYFRQILLGNNPQPDRESQERIQYACQFLYSELITPILVDTQITIRQKLDLTLALKNIICQQCYVIHIFSEDRAEAYKLFAVLNDRGMSLTDGDLLRTRSLELLEGHLHQQEQVVLYWDKILSGKSSEIDKYLRCYYASYTGVRAPLRDLFDKFCEHFFTYGSPIQDPQANDIELKVKGLLVEQETYGDLIDGEWPYQTNQDQQVSSWDRDRLKIISTVFRHTLCFPLLQSAANKLPEKTFSDLVNLLEIFAFRYILVVGGHPSAAEEIYYKYAQNIRHNPVGFSISQITSELQQLQTVSAPDGLFEEGLKLILDYEQSNKRKLIRYFLTTIETYLASLNAHSVRPPVPDKMIGFYFDNTTIEHIYPRNARPVDIDLQLEPVKDQLGNLSIWAPADNQRSNNDPFLTKKPRYQQSRLLLNRELANNANWTIQEFGVRQQRLLDLAKRVYRI